MDPRRTQAIRWKDLDWLARPHADDRYLANSRVLPFRGCKVELIPEPSKTLEAILPAVYLDLNRLIYLGNRAHPGTFMHVHLARASTLAVARRGDEVVGFSLATHLILDGRRVVLHNATAVAPDMRGRAMSFLLNAVHLIAGCWRARGRVFYSAARTNNPLVYGAMLSSGPYYPDPLRVPPEEIREVARSVARYLDPDAVFDEDVFIQRHAWKKVLGGTTPRHWRPEVNAYCDRHLRIAEGDGLIAVARFTPATMARILWRSACKQIIPHSGTS